MKRDLKNVQQDLRILEEYGFTRMAPTRGDGKRPVSVLEDDFASTREDPGVEGEKTPEGAV